jgi:hypothetical protein
MPDQQRRLSSRWTLFYKFVFPTLWSSGFGLGTLLLFVGPSTLHPDPPPHLKWVFLAVWSVVTASMLRWLAPLKRVTLEGDHLVVSNFSREEAIPLRDIESVQGSVLTSPERVSLRLWRRSVFGDTIVFLPRARLFPGFNRHPVVFELRALIGYPPNKPLQPTRAAWPNGQREPPGSGPRG